MPGQKEPGTDENGLSSSYAFGLTNSRSLYSLWQARSESFTNMNAFNPHHIPEKLLQLLPISQVRKLWAQRSDIILKLCNSDRDLNPWSFN